ncbi:hypothetical protein QVD99_008123 [Batrachochytrium dendrobatidis]|nr:hypothetical protein O5D80_004725 [Batrachochytrium dendrobatidis]KAK5665284.1 hypothetical protein QVD99_008123 [Batrachochytrium dendrobatidis]
MMAGEYFFKHQLEQQHEPKQARLNLLEQRLHIQQLVQKLAKETEKQRRAALERRLQLQTEEKQKRCERLHLPRSRPWSAPVSSKLPTHLAKFEKYNQYGTRNSQSCFTRHNENLTSSLHSIPFRRNLSPIQKCHIKLSQPHQSAFDTFTQAPNPSQHKFTTNNSDPSHSNAHSASISNRTSSKLQIHKHKSDHSPVSIPSTADFDDSSDSDEFDEQFKKQSMTKSSRPNTASSIWPISKAQLQFPSVMTINNREVRVLRGMDVEVVEKAKYQIFPVKPKEVPSIVDISPIGEEFGACNDGLKIMVHEPFQKDSSWAHSSPSSFKATCELNTEPVSRNDAVSCSKHTGHTAASSKTNQKESLEADLMDQTVNRVSEPDSSQFVPAPPKREKPRSQSARLRNVQATSLSITNNTLLSQLQNRNYSNTDSLPICNTMISSSDCVDSMPFCSETQLHSTLQSTETETAKSGEKSLLGHKCILETPPSLESIYSTPQSSCSSTANIHVEHSLEILSKKSHPIQAQSRLSAHRKKRNGDLEKVMYKKDDLVASKSLHQLDNASLECHYQPCTTPSTHFSARNEDDHPPHSDGPKTHLGESNFCDMACLKLPIPNGVGSGSNISVQSLNLNSGADRDSAQIQPAVDLNLTVSSINGFISSAIAHAPCSNEQLIQDTMLDQQLVTGNIKTVMPSNSTENLKTELSTNSALTTQNSQTLSVPSMDNCSAITPTYTQMHSFRSSQSSDQSLSQNINLEHTPNTKLEPEIIIHVPHSPKITVPFRTSLPRRASSAGRRVCINELNQDTPEKVHVATKGMKPIRSALKNTRSSFLNIRPGSSSVRCPVMANALLETSNCFSSSIPVRKSVSKPNRPSVCGSTSIKQSTHGKIIVESDKVNLLFDDVPVSVADHKAEMETFLLVEKLSNIPELTVEEVDAKVGKIQTNQNYYSCQDAVKSNAPYDGAILYQLSESQLVNSINELDKILEYRRNSQNITFTTAFT